MDKKELQNQIATFYSQLPPESQKVFSSMEWLQTLRGISEKYTLTEPQIQTLGTETTLVMLGIVSLSDYEETVKKELGVAPEISTKILVEIDDQILKKIRPELAATYEKNSKFQGDEKLDERFDNLSEKTRTAISESNYYATLYAIGGEFKLNVAQIGELEAIATNVITGTTHPDKFESIVKEKVGLPEDKAGELVKAVNERILRKIREKLFVPKKPDTPVTLVKLDLPELVMPEEEHAVLNQAGIKIIPSDAPAPMPPVEKKVEVKPAPIPEVKVIPVVPEKIVKPAVKTIVAPPDILTQKLSNSFQMSPKTTDHSTTIVTKVEKPTPESKFDPYREVPE